MPKPEIVFSLLPHHKKNTLENSLTSSPLLQRPSSTHMYNATAPQQSLLPGARYTSRLQRPSRQGQTHHATGQRRNHHHPSRQARAQQERRRQQSVARGIPFGLPGNPALRWDAYRMLVVSLPKHRHSKKQPGNSRACLPALRAYALVIVTHQPTTDSLPLTLCCNASMDLLKSFPTATSLFFSR